jgi:carboxymethylenebutenolidase
MGERHALFAAGHYPDHTRAATILHGPTLVSNTPDSPHLLADRFRGEVYCGFPENDPLAPTATIETLAKLLGPAAVGYGHERHMGAVRRYALPDRDVHHKAAANRDWELIFAMFRR